jgi:hypothetical protein
MAEAMAMATLPGRPPSEVEWEDLLLRLELMTRALRNTVEDRDLAAALPLLREMLAREARVGAWLERHAMGTSGGMGTKNAAKPGDETTWVDPAASVERIVSLRARNFAMVQRRGLGVWDWRSDFEGEGPVSAYQILFWLMSQDVSSLALLRTVGRSEEAPAC